MDGAAICCRVVEAFPLERIDVAKPNAAHFKPLADAALCGKVFVILYHALDRVV
ncbi:MAG TPA: hypothetical protein VKB66_06970 [Candidatus Acidoferrum sp.]|nr:hypothetical protein [Candidatus Acidoferrum sp.]